MRSHTRWIAIGLVALGVSGEASACSFAFPFKPFVPVPAEKQRADEAFPDTLPAVAVEIGRVERTSSIAACSVYADVDLVLRWASPTPVRWEDVGIYVRALDDRTPETPVRPDRIVDGVAHLALHVFDAKPAEALDQAYEIRIVDNSLRLGPATTFRVRFAARPVEPYDAVLAEVARDLASDRSRDAKSYLSPMLQAQVDAGALPFDACGPYSPYGCGAAESVVLARGEVAMGRSLELKAAPAACVGVRQSSGRVVRMVFVKDAWSEQIAAAEWVEGADRANWSRIAAVGCSAMIAAVTARETAQVETMRARHEAQRKRIQERAASNPKD